ncbi:MAG: DUF2232 domain-containing protein [Granulosicoccus sp.]
MMINLAKIADRGPLVAGGLAATLLLAALWIPVFLAGGVSGGAMIMVSMLSMWFLVCSAAVVAFVALRHGIMSATQVVGGCLILLIVLSAVLYESVVQVPLIATVFWLPAVLAAVVLARSVRLNFAVLTVVACGVVTVVGMTLVLGDTTEFWRSQFADTGAVVVGAEQDGLEEQREALIEGIARMMTGAMGVSVMIVALGALFLARSWQAGLFNPGGFQKEFHALSLGKNAALVCVLIIVLSVVQSGQLAGALATVVIFAFFIQGLAVSHSLVKQRGMHRYWLYGIYVLLVIPHTMLLLAALGLADNIFRIRRA